MVNIINVKMYFKKNTQIGMAAIGAYDAGVPGSRKFAGLRDIQWDQVDPEKYIGSTITLKGTIQGAGHEIFVNDMTMTQINGGTASFEN